MQEPALTEAGIYARFLSMDMKKGKGEFKDTNPTLSSSHLKSVLSVLQIELVG